MLPVISGAGRPENLSGLKKLFRFKKNLDFGPANNPCAHRFCEAILWGMLVDLLFVIIFILYAVTIYNGGF